MNKEPQTSALDVRLRPTRLLPGFVILIVTTLLNGCGEEALTKSASDLGPKPNAVIERSHSPNGTNISLLADVVFKDGSVWATDIRGNKLYRSENDGETFETVTTPFGKATQISFDNSRSGWAITELLQGVQLWRTDDGGISWKQVSQPDQSKSEFQLTSLEKLTFVNEQTGWFFDVFGAWRSTDGGEHWNRVLKLEDQPEAGQVQDAAFLDASRARVATTNGIYISNNGGQNWGVSERSTNFSAIYFLDERKGWAVNSDANQIYGAIDGGKEWINLSNFDSRINLRSLYFLNDKDGWAAGLQLSESFGTSNPKSDSARQWRGIALHTSDGGRSWSSMACPDDSNFFRIYFRDAKRGWLLGTRSLYRTVDGGSSWQRALTPE